MSRLDASNRFFELSYFLRRYDLPSKVINLPFILRRSGLVVAVTELKIFPQLRMGKTLVIGANISKYFDTIPHDKLLTLLARQIVEKNILWLINLWLKAPVVEEEKEGKDGKKRTECNPKGTPRRGVLSPLIANIPTTL